MSIDQAENWNWITKETTDMFCKVFREERDYHGAWARQVGAGYLPGGVDSQDARVAEIQRKCRMASGGSRLFVGSHLWCELEKHVVGSSEWGHAPLEVLAAFHDSLGTGAKVELVHHPEYGWSVIWRLNDDAGVSWMENWPVSVVDDKLH